jgi:hypothetical protein
MGKGDWKPIRQEFIRGVEGDEGALKIDYDDANTTASIQEYNAEVGEFKKTSFGVSPDSIVLGEGTLLQDAAQTMTIRDLHYPIKDISLVQSEGTPDGPPSFGYTHKRAQEIEFIGATPDSGPIQSDDSLKTPLSSSHVFDWTSVKDCYFSGFGIKTTSDLGDNPQELVEYNFYIKFYSSSVYLLLASVVVDPSGWSANQVRAQTFVESMQLRTGDEVRFEVKSKSGESFQLAGDGTDPYLWFSCREFNTHTMARESEHFKIPSIINSSSDIYQGDVLGVDSSGGVIAITVQDVSTITAFCIYDAKSSFNTNNITVSGLTDTYVLDKRDKGYWFVKDGSTWKLYEFEVRGM